MPGQYAGTVSTPLALLCSEGYRFGKVSCVWFGNDLIGGSEVQEAFTALVSVVVGALLGPFLTYISS